MEKLGFEKIIPKTLGNPDIKNFDYKEGKSFFDELKKAIESVDDMQKKADKAVVAFAAGEIKDIHTVALALKKAELSFKFLLAVKRRVISAYQELLRLGV